ncbi:hypothetical protein OG963_14390 [Streptomyces sp. NBC_01707]|uniref:hypothetical protein n=1 Tax=Streptomyces sp. NBC_01707 TaxID=2975914 RepID=UPI00352FA075
MARTGETIETRVCIDDMLGPFDCKLNPNNRWNGWLSPYFTLDTARELSAQTLRIADEYGYDCADTVHVIDGREDSGDTVHIIEGGTNPYSEEHEQVAIAVRIRWRNVGRNVTTAVRVAHATPNDRKAARRRKATGRGARRTVIVKAAWQWLYEGSATAADVIAPGRDGLYGIGGWEWTWAFASWWCACGEGMDWHEYDCTNCHLNRDSKKDGKPCACGCDALREGVRKAGDILRELVPNATAAGLIVEDGHPRLISVATADAIVWTNDEQDYGAFDYERIGGADEALRQALLSSTGLESLRTGGWKAIQNDQGSEAYAIKFPALHREW